MIINLTKNKIIARKPLPAVTFAARGRGMIGRTFSDFDAMVFNKCNCIHTMLMSMDIDVLFVDKDNRVCEVRRKLKPWNPLVRCAQASAVIELPAGAIDKTNTELGDILDLNAELSQETRKTTEEQLLPAPDAVIPMNKQVD
jgi:uncharacterized membrane protein (UPF0127 family)